MTTAAPPPGARLIPLTKGLWAIVDEADYAELSAFKWCADIRRNTAYALRGVCLAGGHRSTEKMHRRLLPESEQVDHINGNGLDNRRANLRAASDAENKRNHVELRRSNTSGFMGVVLDRRRGKWSARVTYNGRTHYGGYFHTPEDAARARDVLATALHGEFVSLNFPEGAHK